MKKCGNRNKQNTGIICNLPAHHDGDHKANGLAWDAEDIINYPAHYTNHPSGVECIQITEHMNFCRGNALKYLWRAGEKGSEVEDLRKAIWYIEREIARLGRGQ